MKIPSVIRRRIPRIMSLLEAQCEAGEFLWMDDKPSQCAPQAGKIRERSSIYALKENTEGSVPRYIATLDRVKRRKNGRTIRYEISGVFF